MATVSRGLDFFAFEENALRALYVSVAGVKMDMYAVISLSVGHAIDICISICLLVPGFVPASWRMVPLCSCNHRPPGDGRFGEWFLQSHCQ